jgi:hypothetical protein
VSSGRTITTSNSDLRRELKDVAHNLERAAVDVLKLNKNCSDAEILVVLKLVEKLYCGANRLEALANGLELE